MFFDDYANLEINDIFKISRGAQSHHTKKRNVSTLSCRIDGKAVFTQEDNTITAETGSLLFIPQGTDYSQKTDGEELIVIHLKLNSRFCSYPELFTPAEGKHCMETFKLLYSEWHTQNPGYRQKCTSILYFMLSEISSKRHVSKKEMSSKISNSLVFLKKHFSDPGLSIADIAKQSNISEIYFRKIWQRLYSDTPARYLTSLRINYAKSLLTGTNLSVAEIAERSGFSDTKYFSTKFKKETGFTPFEYRKNFIF